jgi:hypothetical protein
LHCAGLFLSRFALFNRYAVQTPKALKAQPIGFLLLGKVYCGALPLQSARE